MEQGRDMSKIDRFLRGFFGPIAMMLGGIVIVGLIAELGEFFGIGGLFITAFLVFCVYCGAENMNREYR